VWYGDGVRFELLPVARHMWRKRGLRLFIATPGSNVRLDYRQTREQFRSAAIAFLHGLRSPGALSRALRPLRTKHL
jgi:hypothetical protein